MKATSLMYHDVVEGDDPDSSGFPGGAAALYKLPRAAFERHLEAIAAAGGRPQVAAAEGWDSGQPLFLTFDDGGVSASSVIAPLLDKYQWRGHFFMTTNCIGPARLSHGGSVTRTRAPRPCDRHPLVQSPHGDVRVEPA